MAGSGSQVRVDMSVNTGNAEKNIKGVRGMLQGLGRDAKSSILTGVGLGAGVTAWNALGSAVRGVAGFLGDAVTAAMEEETSIQNLTTALEANVKGWDGNSDAIEAVIESRLRLGFSDDEQRASLARLVGATGDVTKSLEMQATAMDLARFAHISLEEATSALVKVDANSLRILKSLGIQLDSNATSAEALAAIQAVASGQAEDAARTTSVAIQALQAEFDNVNEEIGEEFLPLLLELATFAREDLIPALKEFIATIKSVPWAEIGRGISETIGFFTRLAERIGAVVRALQDFNAIFGTTKSKGGLGSFGGGTAAGGTGGSSTFGGSTGGTGAGTKPIPRYAEGTDYVPSTGPALLHAGEMVIPSRESAMIREGGGGGNTYIVNITGEVKVRNPQEIVTAMQRLGYLSLGTRPRPSYG